MIENIALMVGLMALGVFALVVVLRGFMYWMECQDD